MKRFRSVLILLFALTLIVSACSSDESEDTTTTVAETGGETGGDSSGGSGEDVGIVEIFGPETATELEAFINAMAPFEESYGATVLITGDRSFQELNDVRIEGGNPPDIGIYALLIAHETGIDLSHAIQDKIAKNERKYSVGKARGSSKKYTEL